MNRTVPIRPLHMLNRWCFKRNELNSSSEEASYLKEQEESEQLQDEIEKKRDVCRLPDRTRQALLKKEMFPLDRKEYFILRNLRKYYAAFGRKSGINPGLMWPSKDYLKELLEFEREFQPSLNDMLVKVQERKQNELKAKKEREALIEENMSKLPDYMKEYEKRQARKLAEAEMQRQHKERLVEKVHEFVGHQIDPSDERFQQALALIEEEERKSLKIEKKKAREQRMLSLLLETATKKDTAT